MSDVPPTYATADAPFAPAYVPVVVDRPPAPAPVLELEGLDPWSVIPGPGLALDEVPEAGEILLPSNDPAQLELRAPAEPAAGVVSDTATAAVAAQEAAAPVAIAPPPPDPIEILFDAAHAAAEAGSCDEAKALYLQLLASAPAHVRARHALALVLDAEGNHAGALAELDRALDIDPENRASLVSRGTLLGALGRYAAAERDLKAVLRVEPSNGEALFNLGVVMTKKGLWSEAIPHLRRALEVEPARGAGYYYLGEALNHVDDLDGALASYRRAAELQPANPRALYGLGIIYDRLARPDDAAYMYRRAREVGRR
ncbi:MAG TPA: tetratricopeptide repeat protein [Gemmatimonadales bacterium]|nr:tetratricopeptide repeat protein [Gemmatimonadales bacterium]